MGKIQSYPLLKIVNDLIPRQEQEQEQQKESDLGRPRARYFISLTNCAIVIFSFVNFNHSTSKKDKFSLVWAYFHSSIW